MTEPETPEALSVLSGAASESETPSPEEVEELS